MKKFLLVSVLLALSPSIFAQNLTINGAEFGIGKFHRKDNKEHPYDKYNAWRPFILPDGVSSDKLYVLKNSPTSYTIFFTHLDEFLAKVIELSKSTGKKVGVLNLNAHGLPGGMWFPKDAKTRDAAECESWREAANNSDDVNYEQYYSAISKDEILQYDQMSRTRKIPSYQCLTGLPEWAAAAQARTEIKNVFADNAQIHMHSCLVGLGPLGDNYTKGIAALLLKRGKVQTSIKFGLGDWSMTQGMGFWGFESDQQLEEDTERYPSHRRDSEIMQKGDIRVAIKDQSGVRSGLIPNVDFMLLTIDNRAVKIAGPASVLKTNVPPPKSVRVPGTKAVINLK